MDIYEIFEWTFLTLITLIVGSVFVMLLPLGLLQSNANIESLDNKESYCQFLSMDYKNLDGTEYCIDLDKGHLKRLLTTGTEPYGKWIWTTTVDTQFKLVKEVVVLE